MAYQPNTDLSTKKITLSSSGIYRGPIYNPVFTLDRAITLDDRLLHVCGVETITMTHPTYFREEYMTGEMSLTVNGQTVVTPIDPSLFDDTLKCVYAHQFTFSRTYLDAIMFYLISFFKRICLDPGQTDTEGPLIEFSFTGFLNTDYRYNAMGSTSLTLSPDDKLHLIDINDIDNYRHIGCLESLIQATGFRFKIQSNFAPGMRLSMKGNFLTLLGIDPSSTIVFEGISDVNVRLPLYGHDYICMGSSLGSNTLSSTAGGKVSSTNLLAVVPTPRYPDEVEMYQHTGSKVETSSSIIDMIELHFTDIYGLEVLSLEDFIVVLTVDQVKTEDLPQSEQVSLFNVRKRLMEETRKKLRI